MARIRRSFFSPQVLDNVSNKSLFWIETSAYRSSSVHARRSFSTCSQKASSSVPDSRAALFFISRRSFKKREKKVSFVSPFESTKNRGPSIFPIQTNTLGHLYTSLIKN